MQKKQWTQTIASQWGLFIPPARPSLSELVIFEKYLIKLKQKKSDCLVGILGSTVEFRDLCQVYNINYYCIDYNKDNFKELKQYMRHKDTDKHVIVADWREMKLNKKFDMVIGDLATTVTPVHDHEKMYNQIKNHCNPKALVMLKTILRTDNKSQPHKNIFNHYRNKFFFMEPFGAVWTEVLLADYDFEQDTMDCQISTAKLKTSFDQGIITKKEFLSFKKRWDVLGDFKMNIPLKDQYINTFSKYFDIVNLEYGKDWYKKYAPIVVGKVKI